ncbi:MAG TPA: CheR family methyltransferase, partial [Gammaproteobacteria bacterium]|nr:CheR family methyltransferase [Gammaproteobacteria bacterium]
MLIVGVGASAGGFEALRGVLTEMPAGSGIAFIVVFHLDASAHTILLQSLPKGVALTFTEAKDGMSLEPDHVYIAPGRHLVSLQHGVIRLAPLEGNERQRAPIDHFLQSLAWDQKEHAVAVVLSGLGSDGALGLKAVSDAGGMTIVQEPASAQYDAMPQSALDTGAVDHVLNPKSIPGELQAYRDHIGRRADEKELHREVLEALPQICESLLRETGHNFKHYKTSTLLRRTMRRLHVLRMSDVRQYVERLRSDGSEAQRLFQDLLVSVTAFFRDAEAFEALSAKVLPRLFSNRGPRDKVRIWVPGCATGEEAYTLAMLLKEQIDSIASPPQVHVFATDIDEHALAVARQGRYPAGIAEELTPERLERFFDKRGDQFHVKKELRDLCLFSIHNLINDPPFSKLDLVSCRNLLIYLGAHLQQKLIPLFHFALNPEGYLFLGPSENITGHGELFKPVDNKHRISQRLSTTVRQGGFMVGYSKAPASLPKPPNVPSDTDMDVYLVMQRIILDEFAPKCVVVREDGKIVCATGELEKYLSVAAGI